MIKAINNRVLVLPDAVEETTASGIILPEILPDMPDRGKVISVGSKVEDIKEGDYVIYDPMGAMPLNDDGKEYFLFYDHSIVAKLA